MFVILLHYPEPQALEPHRESHIAWVKKHVADGTILFSGPMIPRTGGLIVARASSRDEIAKLFLDEPYGLAGAEHTILEFDAKFGALVEA